MEQFDYERIEQELEKLPREQAVQFVWRCGMRALPFLGAKANFDFWDAESRQKHLHAIFYALDFAAAASSYAAATAHAASASYADAASHAFSSSSATTSAAASASAASAATSAYATSPSSSAYASSASAATAATAATAAYAASAAYAAYSKTSDDAYTTATDSASAAFAAAYAAASYNDKGLQMVAAIWHDLEAVQEEKTVLLSVDLYGDVWEKFQQALAAEGCAWWGRLYQQIFDDELVLSYEALERRLDIPEEMRERGAAEVGKYLEEMEKESARRQGGGEDGPGR